MARMASMLRKCGTPERRNAAARDLNAAIAG
jgi:hypothetical protein